jgi:hypothetical protein
VPVGNINLWLHICPSAPFDARIQDTGVAKSILRHALDVRRARRRCARYITCALAALFYSFRNCMVHPFALSCYAPSLAEMSLCAQCSGSVFSSLTYLSGAFMFTFRYRCRDDALWLGNDNNNKQWFREGRSDRVVFVRARVRVEAWRK